MKCPLFRQSCQIYFYGVNGARIGRISCKRGPVAKILSTIVGVTAMALQCSVAIVKLSKSQMKSCYEDTRQAR